MIRRILKIFSALLMFLYIFLTFIPSFYREKAYEYVYDYYWNYGYNDMFRNSFVNAWRFNNIPLLIATIVLVLSALVSILAIVIPAFFKRDNFITRITFLFPGFSFMLLVTNLILVAFGVFHKYGYFDYYYYPSWVSFIAIAVHGLALLLATISCFLNWKNSKKPAKVVNAPVQAEYVAPQTPTNK